VRLDWYERYVASYQKTYKADPMFEEIARYESVADLGPLVEKGSVFEVRVENELAGIIASDVFGEYFYNGYSKLAAAKQRQLIDRLP